MGKLTSKQRLFCIEYVQGKSAVESAKLAGYSPKTARVIGPENLTKPAIQAEIDKLFQARAMRASEVLDRLGDHARGSIEPFLKVDPETKKLTTEIDFEAAKAAGKLHLIKKLRQGPAGLTIELHDPQTALVHIGRYLKLFSDKIEHSGPDGSPLVPLEAAVAALQAADKARARVETK